MKRNLQKGDVVLLKEDGVPRGQWPLALVEEAHKSKDNLVRTVSLKVRDTVYKRPTHRTVLLVAREEGSTE